MNHTEKKFFISKKYFFARIQKNYFFELIKISLIQLRNNFFFNTKNISLKLKIFFSMQIVAINYHYR